VTAESYHYDDLHRLVDQLNPGQADALRAVALQLVTTQPASPEPRTGEDGGTSEMARHRVLSIAGIISAEPDLAERSEEILRELVERQR
jgi:hypothetical protein